MERISINTPELKSFFEGTVKIYMDYMNKTFPNQIEQFAMVEGSRYIKVCKNGVNGSVHCFVDRNNGDVLKPASWRAPAKHARGNIFDSKNGLGSMGPYGPAYLR